jgi:hypothetical protein
VWTEDLAPAPLAAWFVFRPLGRNGKAGPFSAISVISSGRLMRGKPPGELVADLSQVNAFWGLKLNSSG